VVGADLTVGDSAELAYPVDLIGADDASGLADMLHQFMSQNLEESAKKRAQARRLAGTVLFRAAEDEEVCVRMAFFGDRIELADYSGEVGKLPAITSDFLSTAHLTTGEEGPFALLLKRKVKVSFSVGNIPFLLRVLRFMQLPAEMRAESPTRPRWILAAQELANTIAATTCLVSS
jgi:hypothetical protein